MLLAILAPIDVNLRTCISTPGPLCVPYCVEYLRLMWCSIHCNLQSSYIDFIISGSNHQHHYQPITQIHLSYVTNIIFYYLSFCNEADHPLGQLRVATYFDVVDLNASILNYVVGNYLHMLVVRQNEGNLSIICFVFSLELH